MNACPFRLPSLSSWLALLLAGTAVPTWAQGVPEKPKQASPQEQAEALETTDLPEYPDTEKGLEDLINEMLRLVSNGDKRSLAVYAKSLELSEGETWFSNVFGPSVGYQFDEQTAPVRSNTAYEAIRTIETMRSERLVNLEAKKFTEPCNSDATADEYPILLLRQKLEPLYDIRFRNSSRQTIWGFFAYSDGGFRYVAMPESRKLADALESRASGHVEVSPSVEAGKLIHMVPPDFSKLPSSQTLPGNIVVNAVIRKDGTVGDVSLLEGVCGASEAAIDAVKLWRYSPTVINGEPVEVHTTITVPVHLGS
jgi:hypothetical protein